MATFDAQLLGQTEKAANAILARLLAGPGLTEPQWVALTLTVKGGGTFDRTALAERVAAALHVSAADAASLVAELGAANLVQVGEGEGETVVVTETGQRVYAGIRAEVAKVTQRLWGDLPDEDLATAGRVLSTVLERANAELARVGA